MDLDYPFHIDGRGGTALAGEDDHVRDMIEQFLFTNLGERVNRPDFGSGLLQLVFEPNGPEIASALQFTVQAGLQRWLGDLIEIERLQVTAEDSTSRISVEYRIRRTNERRVTELIRPVTA
jgi:uncharacterized protein